MVAQLSGDYVRIAGLSATWRRLLSYVMFEGRPATTRGQWFNPAVRLNLRLGQRVGGPRIEQPIFVIGVGRSGTTHLGKLLSAHPEVGWLNEPKLMWNTIWPGEDVSGFYSPSGTFDIPPSCVTPEVRRRAERIIGYYLKAVRADRLVDKYPELTYRVPFIRALFPDARVIAIVRRPEDFVNSVVQWNDRHALGNQDWWGVGRRKWVNLCEQVVPRHQDLTEKLESLGRSPTIAEMAATEWIVGMRAIAASETDLTVRYEDLATDPEPTMRRAMVACRLAPSTRVLRLASAVTSSRLRTEPAEFGALGDLIDRTRGELGV